MSPDFSSEEIEQMKEEAGNEAVFRYKVLHQLKALTYDFKDHIDSSEKFRNAVTKLEEKVGFQWWLLGISVAGILSLAFFVVRKGLT